ncbi:MAG TPA: glycosyltransferase family A protein [Ignavibacteria bacterium]|nr:glycosyltransferase family A protein [Ignavibacteria bacterium]HRA98962.1 glycosyltransferase family A protein [Ignavibacteria bacterium]
MKAYRNFKIIEYLNPGWYFNLIPVDSLSYSICCFNSDVMKFPDEFERIIFPDSRFETKTAIDLDAGFQAWNRGIMLTAKNIPLDKIQHKENISVKDEYIFIRKYYKWHRVYYYLIKNLLSFNNPFKEIGAFISTRDIERTELINPHLEYEGYKSFESEILKNNPKVSVIIPTLNRYKYLKDVLEDLEKQDYNNFEVIIADQTDVPNIEFYDKFNLNLKIIFQDGKGQWLARNEAARKCKGDYFLFFDDDSRVDKDWISEHLKGLDYFKADISAGVSLSTVGDAIPENYSFFRWADQFDSGNAMVKREVFEKTGMFDRQFDKMRMGDGEFGLRAYLAGFKSISHPFAKRIHLKVSSGGLRQMGSWDAFRPKNFFSPRPVPSVLYLYRKYYPSDFVSNAMIIGLLPSLIPYKWKGKKYLYPLGALAAIFILPVLLIQLGISWKRSSEMLKEGDKIEWL